MMPTRDAIFENTENGGAARCAMHAGLTASISLAPFAGVAAQH